jgi:hypothetical protein
MDQRGAEDRRNRKEASAEWSRKWTNNTRSRPSLKPLWRNNLRRSWLKIKPGAQTICVWKCAEYRNRVKTEREDVVQPPVAMDWLMKTRMAILRLCLWKTGVKTSAWNRNNKPWKSVAISSVPEPWLKSTKTRKALQRRAVKGANLAESELARNGWRYGVPGVHTSKEHSDEDIGLILGRAPFQRDSLAAAPHRRKTSRYQTQWVWW